MIGDYMSKAERWILYGSGTPYAATMRRFEAMGYEVLSEVTLPTLAREVTLKGKWRKSFTIRVTLDGSYQLVGTNQ